MDRSYLFAPGHNAKLLAKVFGAGVDAVMLDLEDAVPPEADLEAVGNLAFGDQDPQNRVRRGSG